MLNYIILYKKVKTLLKMSYDEKDHILNMVTMVGAGILGGPAAAFGVWANTGKQMLEAEKAERRQREAERRQREAEQRQREAEEAARKAQEESERQIQIQQKLFDTYETFERTRNTNENDAYKNLLLEYHQINIEKKDKHSIAPVGATCAGKTTFTNKAFNLNLVSSPIENTAGITKVYENDNYQVFDIEGCNDRKKYESPIHYYNLKSCHEFIIIYDNSIEHNIKLIKLFLTMNAKLHIVRNKTETMSEEDKAIIEENDKNAIQNIINEMNEWGINQSINLDENYYMISAKDNINVSTVVENLNN